MIELSAVYILISVSDDFSSGALSGRPGAGSQHLLPPSIINYFGRRDLNAKSRESDVSEFRGSEQADGGDPQILENLGAEADLAPLPRACDFGAGRARLRNGMRGHARRAVAQENDHAATLLLETLQGGLDRMCAANDVPHEVGAMQARKHVLAVTDSAVHECHMLDGVERGHIGVAGERADLALHREFADPLDELVARLAIGDEVGDRDLLELVACGECRHVWSA